jgi:arginase family enzyme
LTESGTSGVKERTLAIVCDLDGSLLRQPQIRDRIAAGSVFVIGCQDIAHKLRLVASRSAIVSLAERVETLKNLDQGVPIVFFGSGDFHHLTIVMLKSIRAPVTIINFDNHPDWARFPPLLTCGTWVTWALELPNVQRVITIGPCSRDLDDPEIKTANLDSVRCGQLEVYPFRKTRSRLWGRAVKSPCVSTIGRRLIWRNIAEEKWDDFVVELAARIPTEAVYISIDKDVLSPEEAVTNWDQGVMKLDQILLAIAKLSENHRLLGIDVCGDYSPQFFKDVFRAGISFFDRPFRRAPGADLSRVNALTNERLLAGLLR